MATLTEETVHVEHKPFVPDAVNMKEFTWSAVVVGALLGIVFGASSLYLVLKVGMTVSASIPGRRAFDHDLSRTLQAARFRRATFSKTTSCRQPARPASRSPSASASPCPP